MGSPSPLYFLDTSYVLALIGSSDRHHAAAVAWERRLREEAARLVTHLGILLELGDGFARRSRRELGSRLLDRMMADPALEVVAVDARLGRRGLDLYLARQDKEWGLTDCVSFVLMSDLGLTTALTADGHFAQAGFRASLLEGPPR